MLKKCFFSPILSVAGYAVLEIYLDKRKKKSACYFNPYNLRYYFGMSSAKYRGAIS